MSSSSSSSSSSAASGGGVGGGGGGGGGGASKRLEKLRQVYSRALANWEMLLTQPVKDEEAFKKAFRATLTRHPEVIECARSGGLLATIMRIEFPTLAKDVGC